MTGKTFTEFMDDLAYNPEMEFMFRGERYMISGYLTRDQDRKSTRLNSSHAT